MKIIEEHPITLTEAKLVLSKREKEGELEYEQRITLDYLRKFAKLSKKDIESARSELSKIDGLREHHIVCILNTLPEDEEDIKAVFMKERITLNESQIKDILGILAKIQTKTQERKGA